MSFVVKLSSRACFHITTTRCQIWPSNRNTIKSGLVQRQQRKLSNLSYCHCPDERPLVSATIGQLMEWVNSKYEDREAIVDCTQGIRKTYGEYNREINKLATGFINLGLNVGDRIGLWSSNRYEWLVAQVAASKAGLILVPLNPAYQVPELDYCVKTMQMKAIVTERHFKSQDFYHLMTEMIPEIRSTKPGEKIQSKNHPYFDTLIVMDDEELNGSHKYKDVCQRAENDNIKRLSEIQSNLDPDSTAYVMFTSGTTGAPKGAALAHHGIVNVGLLSTKRNGYDKELFRFLCCPLLFHGLGSLILYFNVISSGSCIVLPSPGFSPALSLKAIEKEKCNFLGGTPTMFFDLLHHPDEPKTDTSSIKRIKMAGSLCPPTLLTQIRQRWKCEVFSAYGMTELAGLVTGVKPGSPPDQTLKSTGTVYEHLELKIVDKSNKIVPRGTSGEICIRGYRVMKGYWNNDKKTKEAISDSGWYRSGDVGIMLEDGTVQVVDRTTDMILRGGENIYPKEIEDFLIGHPKISEAYVIGVPDERLGEEVCAWIKCKPEEKLNQIEIKAFCQGKISSAKIPRYIRFVDDFPKTLSGKIRKNVMKSEEEKRIKKNA